MTLLCVDEGQVLKGRELDKTDEKVHPELGQVGLPFPRSETSLFVHNYRRDMKKPERKPFIVDVHTDSQKKFRHLSQKKSTNIS